MKTKKYFNIFPTSNHCTAKRQMKVAQLVFVIFCCTVWFIIIMTTLYFKIVKLMNNTIFSPKKFDEDEGRQRIERKFYNFGQNFSIIWSTKCFRKANFCRLQEFLEQYKLMNPWFETIHSFSQKSRRAYGKPAVLLLLLS